jgi:hypothetical protein
MVRFVNVMHGSKLPAFDTFLVGFSPIRRSDYRPATMLIIIVLAIVSHARSDFG